MSTCSKCGNTVHAGRSSCLYCGTPAVNTAPGPDEIARCPRCSKDMNVVELGGIYPDVCPGCGGTWYDRDEFDAHLAAVAPKVTKRANKHPPALTETEVRYLRCPRCDTQMARQNFDKGSGVIVDACRDHGVFLDPGELRQIAEYIGSVRQDVVRQQEFDRKIAAVQAQAALANSKTSRNARMFRSYVYFDLFFF